MQNTNKTHCGITAKPNTTPNTNVLQNSFYNARCKHCLANGTTCTRKMLYQSFVQEELYITANCGCDFELAGAIADQTALYGFVHTTETAWDIQQKVFKSFIPTLAHELQFAERECMEHGDRYAFNALKTIILEYVEGMELNSEWEKYNHTEGN